MRRINIPLPCAWNLRFGFSRHKNNGHGASLTTLRSTWQIVELGTGYLFRDLWGYRLWIYGRTGKCVALECCLWRGNKPGYSQ